MKSSRIEQVGSQAVNLPTNRYGLGERHLPCVAWNIWKFIESEVEV